MLEELKKLIGDENYVEVEVETLEHGKIHSKRYYSQFIPSVAVMLMTTLC